MRKSGRLSLPLILAEDNIIIILIHIDIIYKRLVIYYYVYAYTSIYL